MSESQNIVQWKMQPMTASHLDAIVALFLETLGVESRAQEPWTPSTAKTYLEKIVDSEYSLIAEDTSNQVIGAIVAHKAHFESGPVVYIDFLGVKPGWQDKHIGTQLWNQVKEKAAALHFHEIRFVSHPEIPSYQWYTKRGVVPTGWVEMKYKVDA